MVTKSSAMDFVQKKNMFFVACIFEQPVFYTF